MEWSLTALSVTLTAIDLKKFKVFSMILYIFMGWGIAFFLKQAILVLGMPGFRWLLGGGVAYTVGAVLFGLGKKIPWLHAVFHLFVIIGSALHYIAIMGYVY